MTLLPHIAGRVFNTPLLISRAKLDTILGVLIPRLQGESIPFGIKTAQRGYEVTSNGIAVVPILGTLVRRASGLDAQSGLTSYAALEDTLAMALKDNGVKAILLDIDSPGGEAGGVFDLAEKIYAARKIKPIWAVANEDAFSAAYALAAAAEKIYVPRTGGVGSIGVIAVHLDQSKAEENAGLTYTAIYAGDRKNDLSPHEPLSDPARTELQTEVHRLYSMFVSTVARMRGLSADRIKATEAGLYFGENALTAGLADVNGSFNEALAALSLEVSRSPPSKIHQLKTKEKKTMDNPETREELEQSMPDLSALKAEAKVEAMAYVAEVNELCALASMQDKAIPFISKAVPVAEVRKALLDAKAAQADAAVIAGQIPANTNPNAETKIDTAAIYERRNAKKEH
ncbi:MAG: S49 family peptidase [Pseudomonadota bacterium]